MLIGVVTSFILNHLLSYILCSGCHWTRPQAYTKTLLTRYLINCLWEFHQIYNFIEVGHTAELIRFWGQKIKGQGHSEIDIFSPHLSAECMDVISETYHIYSLQGSHNTNDIFKVMGLGSRSQATCSKNTLVQQRNTNQWFAVKGHLVSVYW